MQAVWLGRGLEVDTARGAVEVGALCAGGRALLIVVPSCSHTGRWSSPACRWPKWYE